MLEAGLNLLCNCDIKNICLPAENRRQERLLKAADPETMGNLLIRDRNGDYLP